jgi:hypothetical protein
LVYVGDPAELPPEMPGILVSADDLVNRIAERALAREAVGA